MKLYYLKGKKFGNAISPLIFKYYLCILLDYKPNKNILGISLILDLLEKPKDYKKIYQLSSGYQKNFSIPKVKKVIKGLRSKHAKCCDENILKEKQKDLLAKMNELKYKH